MRGEIKKRGKISEADVKKIRQDMFGKCEVRGEIKKRGKIWEVDVKKIRDV